MQPIGDPTRRSITCHPGFRHSAFTTLPFTTASHIHSPTPSHSLTTLTTPRTPGMPLPRRRRPPRPGALADLSPTRIASQIVLLQLAYYACAAVLIIFTALTAGKEVRLDLLLSWRSLRGDTTVGWTLGLVWVLNSLAWYGSPSPPQAQLHTCVCTSLQLILLGI